MDLQRQDVVFARINRRQIGEATVAEHTFREDMIQISTNRLMRAYEVSGKRTERAWVITDTVVQPDLTFMTGTLGYTDERQIVENPDWSWIKASPGKRLDSVVPFALDLRITERWLAFAPAPRLRPKMFADGFGRAINAAVAQMGLTSIEWEVDFVVSRQRINNWLQRHPAVHLLRRTVKFPNPAHNLDEDRQEMRALNAQRMMEEFHSSARGVLDIDSVEFTSRLDGTETGDIDIYLKSRRPEEEAGSTVFSSNNSPDRVFVESFVDLYEGVNVVLEALRQYVTEKSTQGLFEPNAADS